MRNTKKFVAALLCAIVLISSVPFSAFADNTAGTVTGSYVYIRSGPGTGYSVLGGCLKGSSVLVTGEENGWYKISYNGIEGYMTASYVERSGSAAFGTVTGSVVNLRKSATTSSSIVAMVTAGTHLPILEKTEGWYKVAYNEDSAYISADYFRPDSESSSDSSSSSGSSSAAVSGTGTVKYDIVNLRSGPGTTYTIVAVLVKDKTLTVTAEVNGWYRVDYNGTEAYISKDLVDLTSGSVISSGTIDISGKGTVTGAVVNIRSGPGTGYSVIGQVTAGQTYTVSGESNGWYKLNFNGVTAYISANYMKVTADSNSVTVGTVTASLVNIRSGAGMGYPIISQASYGDTFTVISKSGSWFCVSDANGQKGYISASYLTTSVYDKGSQDSDEEEIPEYTVYDMNSSGMCVVDSVNVRKHPTTDSSILGSLSYGEKASVTGYSNGWYRIEFNGSKGFVNGNYFLVTEDSGSSGTTTPDSGENSSGSTTTPAVPDNYDAELANQIVEYAMSFLGVPYRYGGADPSTGFDCSGLTQYVYNHFGYTICRTTQYKEGVPVERDELLPGDLVFFNTTGYGIGHVGMYIGDNQFIHAPSPGKTVCITRMDTDYYNPRFVCAVRII
ncbi:MAG: SH3 domain-containing protein [Clostridia bacterium]|nr:SH3 domain-containing protein [Clostridia bacterium]